MDSYAKYFENSAIPRFVRVKRNFDKSCILPDEINNAVNAALDRKEILSTVNSGMRICITCGSRGIDNYVLIIRALVDFCKSRGALPFIVPSMGSHGGATAEGQLSLLESLGITESSVGCPIKSSMDTEKIGVTSDGRDVYIDSFAAKSDGIIVVNRIKPHTSFRGPYTSGLMKMMAIGLGKQKGAAATHADGFINMHKNVPLFGKVVLENAPVLFGFGIIENAFDKTHSLYALTKSEIIEKEPSLQETAARLMPNLGFGECDVLIVDQMGKNISGCGMDPNITGVYSTPGMTGGIDAKRRCVLRLTEETHGNGYGMGAADAISRTLYEQLDLTQIYPNSITSTSLGFAKIPVIMPNDFETIMLCISSCNGSDRKNPKIIRIKNTLLLSEFEISENLADHLPPDTEIISEPYDLIFDKNGNLDI